jgi:hypothetical protein
MPAGWVTWPVPSPRPPCTCTRRGRRHLVDPTRLVASAEQVYGALLDSLYGRLDPTPAARIEVLDDGDEIVVGPGRTLTTVDSPGHAKHTWPCTTRPRACSSPGRRGGPPARRRRPPAVHPAARLRPRGRPRLAHAVRRPPPRRDRPRPLRPRPRPRHDPRRGGRHAAPVGARRRAGLGARGRHRPPPSTTPSPRSWRGPTRPCATSRHPQRGAQQRCRPAALARPAGSRGAPDQHQHG